MPENNEHNYPPRRRKKQQFVITPAVFILAALLIAVVFTAILMHVGNTGPVDDPVTPPTTQTTAPTESKPDEPSVPPTEPPITVTGTATIGATGDMLMHMPCVTPALQSDGSYDFGDYFTHFSSYVQAVDYAVANLETTLAGSDYVRWYNGKKLVGYYGYPSFNSPDDLIPSLKSAGFDMLLTANNHTYDTGTTGFHRTQEIIAQNGIDYTGTNSGEDDANYLIKTINGICVGMICYTYETDSDTNKVSLNGIPMTSADSKLINVFLKDDVKGFSKNLETDIANMKDAGAEAIVLYIHWGEEYQTQQNSQQTAMAQAACDLGVDVIVGGHPHVIQPIDLLTSTTDDSHKTVCLYSTGNALSNQRRENMDKKTGHTEDGIFFTFSFVKYSDGTVRVENVEALPLWVNMYASTTTGKMVYDILPLDKEVKDWKTEFQLTSNSLASAEASYERTMKIVGEGLEEVQTYLAGLPEVE